MAGNRAYRRLERGWLDEIVRLDNAVAQISRQVEYGVQLLRRNRRLEDEIDRQEAAIHMRDIEIERLKAALIRLQTEES